MKKKILYGLLAIVLVFGLTACGGNKNENNSNSGTNNNGNSSNKEGYNYEYKDGVLTQIVDEDGNPKQTDFVIEGIILVGNRHEYREEDDTSSIMDYLTKQGYKKDGLNKDFYLGEWIEFYIDTKYSGSNSDVKIIVTPHKTVEEYEKLSLSKLEELANENGGFVLDYQTPEEDNYKYVGNGFVHQDYKEGKYDALFTYKGKLAYFIGLSLTKEE